MKGTSTPRTVCLTEYLIEQGAGGDPVAQAAIFVKIFSGALPAFITVHPASPPIGASTAAVLRHAMNAEALREVPALSNANAKAAIKDAALGRKADFALLDRLTLHVPAAPDRVVVKPAAKALRPAERERIILKAIEDAGLDRFALAKPKKGERTGDRQKVWRKVPSESMSHKDFENSWASMAKSGTIRFAPSA
ncbi:hypothetical protein E4582_09850 [Luteimonas yindakuii]|uniref:Uncharacterized protein n=1 Tax=Luteimonas yindakuii TaxID=2565782 RepID=A0A4Z1RFT6_9GAMM|nr:hypothetical protein [Luteimonas yindakuii]TKS55033.1 hypothetical protein E4582_09850 [Luteimonas yindakuii]